MCIAAYSHLPSLFINQKKAFRYPFNLYVQRKCISGKLKFLSVSAGAFCSSIGNKILGSFIDEQHHTTHEVKLVRLLTGKHANSENFIGQKHILLLPIYHAVKLLRLCNSPHLIICNGFDKCSLRVSIC